MTTGKAMEGLSDKQWGDLLEVMLHELSGSPKANAAIADAGRKWLSENCPDSLAGGVAEPTAWLHTVRDAKARDGDTDLALSFDDRSFPLDSIGWVSIKAQPLYTSPAPAECPAGWKLVPIEPNWDMRNEGRELLIDGLEKDPEKLAYFLWKTMISAAPPKEP